MPILCDPADELGRLLARSSAVTCAPSDSLDRGRQAARPRPRRDPGGDRPADARSTRRWRSPPACACPGPPSAWCLTRDEVDVGAAEPARCNAGCARSSPAGDDAGARRRLPAVHAGVAAQLAADVAARRPGSRAPDGQIITVFAAKGGVRQDHAGDQPRASCWPRDGHRVCVVDLDLAFGDVAISMQLDPARTIVDAVPMAGHLDTTGAASLLTRYRPGLEMLLAPVAPGDAEKISAGAGRRAARRCCAACSTTSWWTRRRSSASTC